MRRWAVFLGGRDLEMVEIAKLLAARDDVDVHDRGLCWGATASAYLSELQEALAESQRVVLVELTDDLPETFPRDRVTFIDHHGALAGEDKPTPLEQVFTLLGFAPAAWTRDLALVAANDRGHIAALRREGATAEQVRDIRDRDRRAQGTTDAEEQAGLEAARSAENCLDGRLTVARLPHGRTATVADALDPEFGGPGFQNLLVHCPQQTLFFGEGRCIEALRQKFPGGWYGGELPTRGYWGIARVLAERPVLDALKVILMFKPAIDISVDIFHQFLIWPLLMRGVEPSIDKHVDALKAAGWHEPAATAQSPLSVDPDYTYEEVVYFHPFVRDLLFGDGKTRPRDSALRRFKRTDVTAVDILIEPRPNPAAEPLRLRVERTEVLLLRPRVLILLVEVSNRNADDTDHDPKFACPRTPLNFDKVLKLQSRLRHIYPPYFNGTAHGDVPVSVTWRGLAESGQLTLASPKSDFDAFVRKGAEPPMYAHWRAFFGKAIQPLRTLTDRDADGLFLQQMIDDRIPSTSFIAVSEPSEIHPDDADRLPAFDPPELDYDPEFRDRFREQFRYLRFSHFGTTYYCNGTSFCVVCKTSDQFTQNHLLAHFRRHYTHIALIAQFQHAALLYFADELADTAKDLANRNPDDEYSDRAWRERIRVLQHRFLKFRTRSYFTEVSNQVQGKDLFRLWFDRLGTAALFERVSTTNAELYRALENQEMKELAWEQKRLAQIATLGLSASIFLTALGALFAWIPIFVHIPTPFARDWAIRGAALAAVLPAILILLSFFYWRKSKNSRPETNAK
ncbi:MAG: hypothetical protein P4L84_23235 [Isosphaeraceae bacterium]|nr:hypothetical protein [Isosphaeraceae bacterium]